MTQGWRPIENFGDWMRNIERRLSSQERRPPAPTVQSLLGPGFGPRAVELLDWNSQAARFNGYWFSEDAANAPAASGMFLGLTIASVSGHVFQLAVAHEHDITTPESIWTRRMHTHGNTSAQFSPWMQVGAPTGVVMFLPVGDTTPVGWLDVDYVAPAGLRAIQRL